MPDLASSRTRRFDGVRLANAFLTVVAALAIALVPSSSGIFAGTTAYRIRAGAPAPHALDAWLAASWAGKCFPEITYAFADVDAPAPAFPKAATVAKIAVGAWGEGFFKERILSFLRGDVMTARVDASGHIGRVLAMAYDASHATVVAQQLTNETGSAGFVRNVSAPPRGVPAIDAGTATVPAAPLAIAALPPHPTRAEIVRDLGTPSSPRRACGLTEFAYEESGPTPLILYAVFDAQGTSRAVLVQRATGGYSG